MYDNIGSSSPFILVGFLDISFAFLCIIYKCKGVFHKID